LIIIVAPPTGFFRAVRDLTLNVEQTSIQPFERNLFMERLL
jgi:hypothetical protein